MLGLSLARLYLDYQGVLREQVLVPLDAHQDLYREPRARRTAASRVDQQRTDLALFDLDAQARRITCRLIEVKCYTTLGEISDYERLKERIAAQLDASADLISHHFDPRRLGVDRPDRTVKNLELSALLGHYLERAIRHRVIDADAASEANWLLDHLDAGYRLDFTRTGLVFDLARAGTDTETDGGIEFHRIGRDLIQELVDAVPTQPHAEPAAPPMPDGNVAKAQLADRELTLPRLPQAAFQSADRTHETPDIDLGVLDPQDQEPEPDDTQAAVGKTERPPTAPEVKSRPSSQPPVADASQINDETPDRHPQGKRQDPAAPAPTPDVFLGTTEPTAQFGIIGRTAGRTIALDLDETHTISLFGVQGGGKSYTLGSIIEMATLPIPGVNRLANPLATILFHYSQSQTYAPEF